MKNIKTIYTFFLFLIAPKITNARNTELNNLWEQYQIEIVLGLAVVVCLMALLVLLVSLYALRSLIGVRRDKTEEFIPQKSWWRKVWESLNASVPVEKENIVLTNHSYDGIRELDNRLPPWWLYGFYFTIAFAVVYLFYFHVFQSGGSIQEQEYEREMAEAKKQVELYLATMENSVDETNVVLLTESMEISAGEELYHQHCVACHGAEGQGGVGPNFADNYWIHGGTVKDIFKTIKYGVPEKGMISWKNQFSPKQMQQLASFIITFEGTNPANQKAPEGALYEQQSPELEEEEKSEET